MRNELAAIFKYNDIEKKYVCDALTIVSVDDDDNFIIKMGDYTGYDNSVVKRIIDNNISDKSEIEIEDDNKRLAIFIIDNKMFNEIRKTIGDNKKIMIIRKIREVLQKTELINKTDNIYITKQNTKDVSNISLYDIFTVRNFWQDNENEFVNNIEIMDDIIDETNNLGLNYINEYSDNIIDYKGENFDRKFKDFTFIQASDLENDELFKKIDEIETFNKDIDVVEIIKSISKKIVGQEEAIKTIVTNIYYNQKLFDSLNSDEVTELDSRKVSILLDGPSGTGKTAILKEIASKFSLPISIVNSNSFSETGYIGPSITDILKDLYNKANENIELTERGIIVLDEVDKIACNPSNNGKDMKKCLQEELLGFISGGKYTVEFGKGLFSKSKEIDTSKITFILSGAFTELRENKIKENNTTSIGFNSKEIKKEKTYIIDSEDYIEYGLMREFFGRIKVLTSTKGYSIEDLKDILLSSEISPLKNFEKTVKMFGYEGIQYTEDFIERLCEEAFNQNTGARALQTYMSGIQNMMLQDLITKQYKGDIIKLDIDLLDKYEEKKVRSY